MNAAYPETALQLQSTVKREGVLELALASIPVRAPRDDEVLIRVEAAPINPSDLGLMFALLDASAASRHGTEEAPLVRVPVPEAALKALGARVDKPMPVGNEGAGIVVAAGSSAAAQALIGRTVAAFGGAMYSQYRTVKLEHCIVLPEGIVPAQAASCFVNPLTALGMVETMRMEGHSALVHTAAASNLGQMLQKICFADGVPLVNIVRKREHAALLKDLGAEYVCNSSEPDFVGDLREALVATGATIAFDAIGGGRQAGQILAAMEHAALRRSSGEYSRYGSTVHKQVYIYGGLDTGPTEFTRSFGMSWSIGGWLLMNFLPKAGPEVAQRMRERVAAEITTTFASHYTREVSLTGALDLAEIAAYRKMATGEKYLIMPHGS